MFPLTRSSVIALTIALGLIGCGDDRASSPVAPTAAVLSGPAPTVTGLTVQAGSTGGGTPTKLRGTELQRGASVTFGTATVRSTSWDPRDVEGTTLYVHTPPHAAGFVDVTVTNPNGQTFRLSRGYEYVPQDSFDFNGEWDGVTTDGSDTTMQFTIRNNVLVTASCQGQGETTVALSRQVSNGDFALEAANGFSLSGRIVAASDAIGRMIAPACNITDSPWWAAKLVR